jgi:hypothetical protein
MSLRLCPGTISHTHIIEHRTGSMSLTAGPHISSTLIIGKGFSHQVGVGGRVRCRGGGGGARSQHCDTIQ